MNMADMADRIQHLRKAKSISQEELADKLGVSRQAVSKWESGQSTPDLDKIILISDYFEVTTDYILKGVEEPQPAGDRHVDAAIFVMAATILNFIGLIVAAAIWYEKQMPMALVIGLIFMALGCMIFGVGMTASAQGSKKKAVCRFWSINIWLLAFIPLSFIYNILLGHMAAPYPLLVNPPIALPIFWLVYIALCLTVVFVQIKKQHTI